MKNRSVFFLISLLFAQKVFCFELKQTPKIEVFTQFEAKKDLYIMYQLLCGLLCCAGFAISASL